jgi:hypothetical protein
MAKQDQGFNSGLGDIDHILCNQGVSDLSWLAIDEADYRAHEALPKQNLDIIPELQHALSMSEDDDVPHIIPLKPHTIVNQNPIDGSQISPTDMTAPIRNRVAHMVIAGLSTDDIRRRISLEFAPGDIKLASDAVNEVLFESGLLGNVYVDSKHFPRCASSKTEQKLVSNHAKKALFILAKESCPGCTCNHGGFCSSMSKKIVDEVPYGPKLAAKFHQQLAAEKRPIDLSNVNLSKREWKEKIRAAFSQPSIISNPDGVLKIQTRLVPKEPVITAADMAAFWARRSTKTSEVFPSSAYTRFARRMMAGQDDVAVLAGSGSPELVSLASEYGLLGHTYLDMDALGGCRNTVNFIQNRNNAFTSSRNEGIGNVPDFILRRASTCPICKNLPDGACAELARISVITNSKPALDKRTFARSLIRAVGKGTINTLDARIASSKVKDNANWTLLTAQANLYKPKEVSVASYEGASISYHHGSPSPAHELGKAEMDPEEVRRTLSHLMNQGLSGRGLQAALLKRYSKDDLVQVPEIGRRASINDGVQGYYFIDPTAYRDYGRGCNDGAKLFRKQGAPNVLASDKCTGCQLQTHPGWCSKYSKDLINSIPDEVVVASREAMKRLPVVKLGPVENPVEKYELASELIVDIGKPRDIGPEITINSPRIDQHESL